MAATLEYSTSSLTSQYETDPLLDHPLNSQQNHSSRNYTSLHSSLTLQSTSIISFSVICICMAQLCERVAFYGIDANLVLFATDENQLNFTATEASVVSYVFQGTCYLIPVFGAWLADTVTGKFSVILHGVIIYLVGAVLLPAGAISQSDTWADSTLTNTTFKRAFYITGLFLVAYGSGAIKANVSTLGADQVSKRDPDAIQAFFAWLYWFTYIGTLIAFTFVAYVQQEISYFYGYLIPILSIVITLLIFLAGKRSYRIRPPADNALSMTLKIIKEAIQKYCRPVLGGSLAEHWLDRAQTRYGGDYAPWQVEYVKRVLRLTPLFATFILISTIFAQLGTSFVYQGQYMDINLTSSFKIPIASLSILEAIAVIVSIPIMDKLVFPLLRKYNINLSQLQRIGIGMILLVMSMVIAGGLELYRVDKCCMLQDRGFSNSTNVSNISIFYQVPQYTLMGLAESFTSVTEVELAYSEAPGSFKGVAVGCVLLTYGLGRFFGAAVVAVVNLITGESSRENRWYPDKDHINQGKLAYYFFFLAALMVLDFILYILAAANFKAKRGTTDRDAYDNECSNVILRTRATHVQI